MMIIVIKCMLIIMGQDILISKMTGYIVDSQSSIPNMEGILFHVQTGSGATKPHILGTVSLE
jgi:hypothetical protein